MNVGMLGKLRGPTLAPIDVLELDLVDGPQPEHETGICLVLPINQTVTTVFCGPRFFVVRLPSNHVVNVGTSATA